MLMFKKGSIKIPNNSTTSSSSNQDVRPIQCLLAAEKAVLQSLQKLSEDYSKAAEALRNWGLSEDNDLGGILTASTTLFNHFSLALSQYASHGNTMQRQLEVMAKKGESLDALKQRRKTTHQKAEETAHQLNKMNPDNKYYSMHAEALKRLRKDVRKMDEDIRLEETILIDHKQTATKVWMRLKFGGLHECCEKGSIAGKYGKFVTAEFEGLEDINQPGMPRNIPLQNKIESFIVEADRHVHAVGLSVVGSRNGDRNPPSTRPYNASPTSQEAPYQPPIPQNPQPFHSGNGPQRQDSSFQPSSGYQYAPPSQQPQPSQGSVNPARTSPPSQYSRVTEGAVDEFGTVPNPNNQRGQFGSSESGGQSLGGPVVDGRRRDASFSESTAGPSRFQDQPPPSQWQQQQPTPSQWQNSYQYPVHMRPPIPSESGYSPQDPPSQGERKHLNSESSYPAGPQWQTRPVILRPPGSSDGYPPSQSGSSLNDNSSYSAGPSHGQSPPRPPVSSEQGYPPPTQGGGNLNGNSSYSAGPSHVQSPPRPPVSTFPSQGGSNQNGGNSSYSTGPSHMQNPGGYPSHDPPPSHWQNHPSDRYPMGPPPPQPPLGGHPGNSLHPQRPINSGPNISSGASSYSESTNSQWTPTPHRYSGGSESTAVTSDGMSRPRDGTFNNNNNQPWNGRSGPDPDESPPAYAIMGHPGSTVSDTGDLKRRNW